jgi:hypothetical protein
MHHISTASCAPDEVATGGGIRDSGGGNTLNTVVDDSGIPSGAPTQWRVTLTNLGPSFVTIQAFAECAQLVDVP